MMQIRQAIRHVVLAALAIVLCVTAAQAQTTGRQIAVPISLSGPRVGATVLSSGVGDTLRENLIDVGPVVSQFGWQFEKRFKTGPNGLTAVSEWVVLAGGLEQGVILPSVSWLVGLRTGSGLEFGVGPNITPVGVALAVATGVTFKKGNLNVPVNVAVVPSRAGVRVSLLTGFNMRK
jgi:hypothetical protein